MNNKKNFKILFISLLVSLPFWLGLNILNSNLENFFFWQKIIDNPQLITAQADALYQINKTELERKQNLANSFEVEARSLISVEIAKNGKERILFEENSQEPMAIASLTKLMTALVIFKLNEDYNFSQIIKISPAAVEQEGNGADLKPGEEVSVKNLLHIMLIESSNDAAYALTAPLGYGNFVKLMNSYAQDIGLKDTRFVNPTGLEDGDSQDLINVSTSRDLVKLAKYILDKYPQIFEISRNISYEVLNPDGTLRCFIPENTNILLREFPEIIGGKTGWSPQAEGCLLVVLENPERNSYFINVVLGAQDRFEEMRKLIELVDKY